LRHIGGHLAPTPSPDHGSRCYAPSARACLTIDPRIMELAELRSSRTFRTTATRPPLVVTRGLTDDRSSLVEACVDEPTTRRPFSMGWMFTSVGLFLGSELLIGTWIGPLVLGKYVSPMFHMQLQMMMHLASFYLGGLLVGIISPGVRLQEPATAAFLSVALVFMISFFMPTFFYPFSMGRMLVGGVIALVIAVAGAYSGEKVMGNIAPDEPEESRTARGRLRAALWSDDSGAFSSKRREVAPPAE
jgi:hypothetical protein